MSISVKLVLEVRGALVIGTPGRFVSNLLLGTKFDTIFRNHRYLSTILKG